MGFLCDGEYLVVIYYCLSSHIFFLLTISVFIPANITHALLFSGLDVDGIYRVSGNLATIQKLRFIINQGKWFI